MKNSIKIVLITTIINVFITSCNNTKTKDIAITKQQNIKNSKGYKLMETKCYSCHIEAPNPAKINQIIAPPMLRVKEHYLPSYPNKEDFINAIINIVNAPSEENTLMPGAIKKFNLMPKLNYNKEEVKLIAETIYKYDFGTSPKIKMLIIGDLRLNDGNRWKLKSKTIKKLDSITNSLYHFKSDNIKDYNQFGKDLFEQAKFIMLDKSYTGDIFNQIHVFFNSIESDIHSLIEENSIENAKKLVKNIKIKFKNVYNFFEEE